MRLSIPNLGSRTVIFGSRIARTFGTHSLPERLADEWYEKHKAAFAHLPWIIDETLSTP